MSNVGSNVDSSQRLVGSGSGGGERQDAAAAGPVAPQRREKGRRGRAVRPGPGKGHGVGRGALVGGVGRASARVGDVPRQLQRGHLKSGSKEYESGWLRFKES